MPESPPIQETRRRDLTALGVLSAAALALRLVHLTRFELWVDEAATWHFARLTVSGRLFESITLEPTPPLYYGLIGILMRLFGESDLVMRLPSAVFGAAAVPVVFVLGHELFSRRVAYLAAALLAVHPLHVFYSREARVYPLLLLVSLLLWLFLWRALNDGSWRSWAPFGATLLAACYSHFYGLFLGATAGVAILLWSPDARTRWRGLTAATLAGLAFAPYLLFTLPHLRQSGAAWSVERMYEKLPEERRFGRALETGLVGADYHAFMRQISRPPTPAPLRWASLLAQAALLLAALAAARRQEKSRETAFLLVAWLLPLLVPWTINHWRVIFQTGRHDFYVIGTVCALLAMGLAEALNRRRALAAAAILVLALAAGHRLWWLARLEPAETARRTAAWIAGHAADGDRVVAMGIRRLVSEHYALLAGSGAGFESFPASTDSHPGWSDVETLLEDEAALAREAGERVAELGRTLDDDATLFVLLRPYQRTSTAVSAHWLVDRHLVESLTAADWRPVAPLENHELSVAAFRPPPPKGES